jgi:excisionase family DNA binding protein
MKLLTVKEVSKVLRVNPSYVYELMNKGHLNYLVLGSKKVTDFELERFLGEAQGKDFSDLNNVTQLKIQN